MAVQCYYCDGDPQNHHCTSKSRECPESLGYNACLIMKATYRNASETVNVFSMACVKKHHCSETVDFACAGLRKMWNMSEKIQVAKCSGQCCTTDLCNKPPIGKAMTTAMPGTGQQEVAYFGAIFTAALSSILLPEWMLGNN